MRLHRKSSEIKDVEINEGSILQPAINECKKETHISLVLEDTVCLCVCVCVRVCVQCVIRGEGGGVCVYVYIL